LRPVLEIAGLVVRADDGKGSWIDTIRNVDLTVSAGEVVALIGESGAGKSTVALAALGYARPGTRLVEGRILFDGQDVRALDERGLRRLRGRDASYVAQSAQAALNPAIPIGAQIAEPLLIHGIASGTEAEARIASLIGLLDLPVGIVTRFPHQASGGQQQRIVLAMAMACAPRLLVLDEPTTALDVTTQIEVLKAIRTAIRGQGSAAIYVSHDLAVVAQIADRIVVMRHGAIVEQGPTAEIVERPKQPYTVTLIDAVRPRDRRLTREAPRGPAPLLALRGVNASYEQQGWFGPARGGNKVLRDIDLTVGKGEVLAVVGESGSGKSTLARVVAGLHPRLSGDIALAGTTLADRVRRRPLEQRRRIQIIFQSPDLSLNPEERVGEIIGRPRQLYFNEARTNRDAHTDRLLDMVGLPPSYERRFPAELSGGERQRVAIARAFAAEPDLILCDEILSSLDVVIAAQILELMRELKRKSSVAYLFISHDLVTVAQIADRIAVLYAGTVLELGATSAVFTPPHHPYTALLMAAVPQLRRGWLDDAFKLRGPTAQRRAAPTGCPFQPRCPLAIPGLCERELPPLREQTSGHAIRCHRSDAELRQAQTSPVQTSPN